MQTELLSQMLLWKINQNTMNQEFSGTALTQRNRIQVNITERSRHVAALCFGLGLIKQLQNKENDSGFVDCVRLHHLWHLESIYKNKGI